MQFYINKIETWYNIGQNKDILHSCNSEKKKEWKEKVAFKQKSALTLQTNNLKKN